MALSAATREAAWLEKLTSDLAIRTVHPINIHCDNKASMRMAISPKVNHRTKHINAHYHFRREKVEKGDIELYYVSTIEQLADILTKLLGRGLFEKFRALLNICDLSEVALPPSGRNPSITSIE